MRREVRADKRTILLITEPTNECDPRPKSRGSYQCGCDVSSELLLARPDAALSSVWKASTYKKSSIETQPTPATSNWFTSRAAASLDCSKGLFCGCTVMDDCPIGSGHALDVVDAPNVAANYRTHCSGPMASTVNANPSRIVSVRGPPATTTGTGAEATISVNASRSPG